MTMNNYIQQHSFLERGHEEPMMHPQPFPLGQQQRQLSTTSYCSDSVNNYDVADCRLDSFDVGSTTTNESDSDDGNSYSDNEDGGDGASAVANIASDAEAYMQQQYQRQQQPQQTQKEDPYRMASFQTSRQQQQQPITTPNYTTTATITTGLMNPPTASGVTGGAASFAPSFFRCEATTANDHPYHQYQQQQQQHQVPSCFALPAPATVMDTTTQYRRHRAKRVRSVSSFTLPSSFVSATGGIGSGGNTSVMSTPPTIADTTTPTPQQHHCVPREKSASASSLPSCFAVAATTGRIDDPRVPRVKSASSPSILPSCFVGPVPGQRRQHEGGMIGMSASNTIDTIPQYRPQQQCPHQQQQFEHGVTTADYGSFIPNETTFDDIWEE